jgi:DNA-binding beta-propeller fold protein YncE
MKRGALLAIIVLAGAASLPGGARGEIFALLNYETKSADSLKVLKHPVATGPRREGIAVIDVDPASPAYGKIVKDLPLPADLVAHHIFFNKDASKAYVTALGKGELRVIDLADPNLAMKTVAVPDCQVGEDVVFSDDNKRWFLSCMGSSKVVMGDAVSDVPVKTVDTPKYPHGIAVHDGIDRVLITSTVRASDLGDPGETITALEASTGRVLASYKVSAKASPAGVAPVEVVFLPKAEPPLAYVTNMFGASLWVAKWDPAKKDFSVAEAFDFGPANAGVPLEIYMNGKGDRLYVTTAKPGHLHIFDISKDPAKPALLKSIPAAEGAHHVAFTKDGRYGYVQNALLNLPGMSDGSVTVIDMQKEEAIGSIDTLKNEGLNPNCIVLLPRWNDPAGH